MLPVLEPHIPYHSLVEFIIMKLKSSAKEEMGKSIFLFNDYILIWFKLKKLLVF